MTTEKALLLTMFVRLKQHLATIGKVTQKGGSCEGAAEAFEMNVQTESRRIAAQLAEVSSYISVRKFYCFHFLRPKGRPAFRNVRETSESENCPFFLFPTNKFVLSKKF